MIIECIGSPFTYRWPGGEVHFEPGTPVDLLDDRAQRLLSKAPGKVRMVMPTIAAGSLVSWTRGDGSSQLGTVDQIHEDDTGTRWGFITIGESWAVVNLKFLKVLR